MKILYLTHALPKFKGDRTTVFIRELALAFKKEGNDITVLAPSHPELDMSYQRSLFRFKTFHYLPIKNWEVLGYGKGMSDGLHQNKLNFVFGPFLVIFGIIAVVKTALKEKPDMIFANWGVPDGFIGAVAALLCGRKLAISYIGADVKIITSKSFYSWIARFSADIATVLSTNGTDLKNELVKAGLPEHKFHLVIYGASEGSFKPDPQEAKFFRKKFGISDTTVVVGSIGRFVDKKGFLYLIEAASIMRKNYTGKTGVKFVLFGAGENEELLKKQIERYNLAEMFLLPGPVPPEQLSKVYNCIDIFVNPAVRQPPDGLNVVVVEAMACEKPVVATNACGNELVIQDGLNGFLVPEMDSQALADKITTLITDSEARKEMGRKSRELFLKHFTWNKIVSRYCSLINSTVKPRIITFNKIIDKLVEKRNRKKTEKLTTFCKSNFLKGKHFSVLDLGCGNGIFVKSLQTLPQVSEAHGVDVVDYRKVDIGFKLYEEGAKIPFDENYFDVTFIIEVLHHSKDAIYLLKEAKRITKGQIVIFEDVVTSPLRLTFMKMFDIIMNIRHGVNTPLNFRAEKEWLSIFSKLGFTCEKVLDYNFYSLYTPQHCRVFLLRN